LGSDAQPCQTFLLLWALCAAAVIRALASGPELGAKATADCACSSTAGISAQVKYTEDLFLDGSFEQLPHPSGGLLKTMIQSIGH
jgi:hypothetical protein